MERSVEAEGTVLTGEQMAYSLRKELQQVAYKGVVLPSTAQEDGVVRETFTYGEAGPMVRRATEHRGRTGSTVTDFSYDADHPYRLTGVERVRSGMPREELRYDTEGRCLNNGDGRILLAYDEQGRLASAHHRYGDTIASYGYGDDGLIKQIHVEKSGAETQLSYRDGRIADEVTGDSLLTHLYAGGELIGWVTRTRGGAAGFVHADTDPWGTVLARGDVNGTQRFTFSAYGFTPVLLPVGVFQGLHQDRGTELYVTPAARVYDPLVARWLQPDTKTTSGDPYAYKNNDPFRLTR